jgi:hypothetical protein
LARGGDKDFSFPIYPDGGKTIRGRAAAAGMQDGLDFIAGLVASPEIGRYLAGKLYRFFVSESGDVSAAFVNRVAGTFQRSRGAMNAVPVHAAPEVQGTVRDLYAEFRHYGEPELAVRVDKINRYSSGLVAHKRARRPALLGLRLLLYPPFAFLRFYLWQRYFLNGWAGWMAARSRAFYAFLKYAKVLEAERRERD